MWVFSLCWLVWGLNQDKCFCKTADSHIYMWVFVIWREICRNRSGYQFLCCCRQKNSAQSRCQNATDLKKAVVLDVCPCCYVASNVHNENHPEVESLKSVPERRRKTVALARHEITSHVSLRQALTRMLKSIQKKQNDGGKEEKEANPEYFQTTTSGNSSSLLWSIS